MHHAVLPPAACPPLPDSPNIAPIGRPDPGRLGRLLIATVLACLAAATANAQISRQCVPDPDDPGAPLPSECRSFAFDIEITAVSDPASLYGSISPGSQLQGTFTTFTAFPDLETASGVGQYLNAVECMTLELGDRVMHVELEPVEISLPPSASDPGITVMNDVPQDAGGFTLFTDSVTWLIAGPGSLDPDAMPGPDDAIDGGGGFSFGIGDTCIPPFQLPCPRTLVVDEGYPEAPGDTTGLTSALMTFDFLSFQNDYATANADLLAIVDTDLVPCPEPTAGAGLALGALVVLAFATCRARGPARHDPTHDRV